MKPAATVLLGIPLHPVTAAQALDRIDAFVAAREPRQVVTVNVDFAALAHRDVELHSILCEADLALCDGMPLVWAGDWLGAPIPERVAGSDLLPALLERAALRGHRVFMLGTSVEVLDEARRRCVAAWPGLRICGTHSPPYGRVLAMDHDEMGRLVRAAAPDILLVGLGAPKQEKLIAMRAHEWGVPCSIGVGACIDFLAGRFPRAPAWMRRVGLEWTFRLLNEPRRLFRRYVGDFLFYFPTLAAELLRSRGKPVDAAPPTPVPRGGGAVVDLDGVEWLTPAGLGALLEARHEWRQRGRQLVLLRPSAAVRRLLQSTGLARVLRTATTPQEADEILAEDLAAPQVALASAPGGDGRALRLELRGELTAPGAATGLRSLLELWQSHPRAGSLELDLGRLFALDSGGAAALLELRQAVRQRPGGDLSLRGVSPDVRDVLERSAPELLGA